jgi:hypothetical protein
MVFTNVSNVVSKVDVNKISNMDLTHVLYISYDGMTDPLGQSQVLPYLSGLSKEGFKFHLISFEKEEKYKIHREHIQAICDRDGIVWHPLKYTKKPPIISSVIDLIKMNNESNKIIKNQLKTREPIKLVHARGAYLTSLIAQKMKLKYNLRYIFDMRGFWADERVEGGLWDIKKPHYKLIFNYFKKKELEFIQNSDCIITLTKSAEKIILNWELEKGIGNNFVKTIPCCADLDHFKYDIIPLEETKKLKYKLNLKEEEIVIGYLGSIGTWYMLDEMLMFFSIATQNNNNLKLLFITNDEFEPIKTLVRSKNIDLNRIVFVSATRKEVPTYLKLCDYSLFFIRPTFSKQGSSPVKHGECLGMGLSVICNSNIGDLDLISKESNLNFIIDLNNLQQSVLTFNFSKLKDEQRYQNREIAIAHYDLIKGIEKYNSIYKSLIN